MQETQVQSLGWEDSLEKEMGNHSNVLAWKIPCTEEPGGLQSMELKRVRHKLVTVHARAHQADNTQNLRLSDLRVFSQ